MHEFLYTRRAVCVHFAYTVVTVQAICEDLVTFQTYITHNE